MKLDRITRWRAVGSGVLVVLGVDIIVSISFLVGVVFSIGVLFTISASAVLWAIVAGLGGGGVAGYHSASGLTRGCWHGLLTGAIGGLSVGIVTVVIGLLTTPAGEVVPSVVIGFMGFLFFLTIIPSIIAGGIGATVHRRRTSAQ